MSENQRKREIFEVIKETLEASSVHAIPNLVKAKHWSLRLVWSAFFLVSVSACAWYLFDTISAYLERKVVTNIQVNYAFRLLFPIVSMCDRNRLGLGLDQLNHAVFLNIQLTENDFESYFDSNYGPCIRFNSGRANNGSLMSFKHIRNR